MKVMDARFMIGAMNLAQLPTDGKPEIALVGRSNVGKSSLINALIGRKNLARTSNQPGKTRQMNYYLINDTFYFVDLPGYGYAKVSKSEQEKWGKLIERYLRERKTLLGVFQLIDSRHEPAESDVHMYQWLADQGLYTAVAATKVDKIARGLWQKSAGVIRRKIQLRTHHPLILFSTETKAGCEEMWAVIEALLKAADIQPEPKPGDLA
jgi:GTP-binding protein